MILMDWKEHPFFVRYKIQTAYIQMSQTINHTEFWRSLIQLGFNLFACDKTGNSVISCLLEKKQFPLAKGFVEAVFDKSMNMEDEALNNVLSAICEDRSDTSWKTVLVKMILESRSSPTVPDLSDFLRLCCRNILNEEEQKTSRDVSKESEESEPETDSRSVHWEIAKQLLLHGASVEGCLDMTRGFRELEDFLTKEASIDEMPIIIPWTSCSKTHKYKLAEVARRRKCRGIKETMYWYHEDPIGSGAFGYVFPGINGKDGMELAIKRIEKLRMARPVVEREIQTLTALKECKQIVQYLYISECKDFSYVILELMEGTLDHYLISTDYDLSKNMILSKDVAMGLKYLHHQNIIHRDLKPSNVLYKTHPELCMKIADFGLSRSMNMNCSRSVMSATAGTSGWIAPEAINSTSAHSKSSDIFSCGLILYYIFSKGEHPFDTENCTDESHESHEEREHNILKNKINPAIDDLSAEVSHLVQKMLEFDDKERPSAPYVLDHPMFWSNKKKMRFLYAVGNQPEFECPSGKKCLTAIEIDLEGSFSTIVMHGKWDDTKYKDMPTIYANMTQPIIKTGKSGKTLTVPSRKYNTSSVVELVRFVRNAISHVSDLNRTSSVKDLILSKFVFLEEFPNLLMEVYDAVFRYRWDKREEIQHEIEN